MAVGTETNASSNAVATANGHNREYSNNKTAELNDVAPTPPTSEPEERRGTFMPGGRPRTEKIVPPQTMNDTGEPSDSLVEDCKRIFLLIQDERHLKAHALYLDVKKRLEETKEKIELRDDKNNTKNNKKNPTKATRTTASAAASEATTTTSRSHFPAFLHRGPKNNNDNNKDEHEKEERDLNFVQKEFESRNSELEKLCGRARLFREAKRSFENVDGDWTFAQQLFGITTFYKREKDGSLSVRVEGDMEGTSLFEQLCVLREIDLNYLWSPFCTSSLMIAELDKLDTVGWFLVGLPNFGLARDACFRAIGCDCTREDGSIVVVGQGIQDIPTGGKPPEDTFLSDDPVLDTLNIPPKPTRMGSKRATVRHFDAVIHITSPTSCSTKIITNIDPNLSFIPQALLEFCMKKICGVLLLKIQGAASKIDKNPTSNPHAVRMREDAEFYQQWLLPKCKGLCEYLGWEMPPVKAFALTAEQLAKVEAAEDYSSRALLSRHSDSTQRSAMTEPVGYHRHRHDHDDDDHGHGLQNHHDNRHDRHHGHSEIDTISEISDLSGNTSSVWRHKNPIKSYLREMEQRTQKRKAAAIKEARRQAENRLKPKEFDLKQKKRLEELRKRKQEAQQRQQQQQTYGGGGGGAHSVGTTNSTTLSLSNNHNSHNNHNHNNNTDNAYGPTPLAAAATTRSAGVAPVAKASSPSAITPSTIAAGTATETVQDPYNSVRLFGMAFSTILLFSMLYFNTNMEDFSLLQDDTSSSSITAPITTASQQQQNVGAKVFGSLIVKGFGTALYIVFCGVVHFVLCDITLVYLFHSTQLGSKTGHHIKSYYSTNVRFIVAAFSGFLVAVSIGKAMLIAGLRGLLWSIVIGANYAAKTIMGMASSIFHGGLLSVLSSSSSSSSSSSLWSSNSGVEVLPTVLRPFLLPPCKFAVDITTQFFNFLQQWFVTYVIHSIFMERLIGIITNSYNDLFSFLTQEGPLGDETSSVVNPVTATTWRYDAFMTCRYLLSYSAIFLLVTVFLFNFFVSSNKSFFATKGEQQQQQQQEERKEQQQQQHQQKGEEAGLDINSDNNNVLDLSRSITPIEEESHRPISFIQRNSADTGNDNSNDNKKKNERTLFSLNSPATTASSTPRGDTELNNNHHPQQGDGNDNTISKNRHRLRRLMKKNRKKGRRDSDVVSAAPDFISGSSKKKRLKELTSNSSRRRLSN